MKFLILSKIPIGAPAADNPVALFQASKEYHNAAFADGSLDCVYSFVTGKGGGMAIANADSHEELWEKLSAYPWYPYMEFEVHPLVDENHLIDRTIEKLQEMEGG